MPFLLTWHEHMAVARLIYISTDFVSSQTAFSSSRGSCPSAGCSAAGCLRCSAGAGAAGTSSAGGASTSASPPADASAAPPLLAGAAAAAVPPPSLAAAAAAGAAGAPCAVAAAALAFRPSLSSSALAPRSRLRAASLASLVPSALPAGSVGLDGGRGHVLDRMPPALSVVTAEQRRPRWQQPLIISCAASPPLTCRCACCAAEAVDTGSGAGSAAGMDGAQARDRGDCARDAVDGGLGRRREEGCKLELLGWVAPARVTERGGSSKSSGGAQYQSSMRLDGALGWSRTVGTRCGRKLWPTAFGNALFLTSDHAAPPTGSAAGFCSQASCSKTRSTARSPHAAVVDWLQLMAALIVL